MALSPLGAAVAQRGRAWLDQAEPAPAVFDLGGDTLAGATPEPVREATIAALHNHLGDHYTRRPGIAPLCRAVATQLAEADVAVDPDKDVVIAGGPQEARFVALRALAPGGAVYLPQPAPLGFYSAAVAFAGSELRWFDPAGPLPKDASGLLLLPNPNPITGQCYDTATLGRIAAWASASNLTVIADETAAPLLQPGSVFTHVAALPGMAERTLTLGSFAGVPGIGAWQVAWFAGARPLATRVRDLKQAMTICSPAASQYAALAGTSAAAADQAAQLERLQQTLALLEQLGIPYRQPHTVAFVLADVAALGGGDAVAATCAGSGVRVLSGSTFGEPGSIRITASPTDFPAALQALAQALTARKEAQA